MPPLEFPSGNMSGVGANYDRILPSFVQTINKGNSNWAACWVNAIGTQQQPVDCIFTALKIPNTAKGILMSVYSGLTGQNAAGTIDFNRLTIYSDTGFTQISNYFYHSALEFNATLATIAEAHFLLFMPIIDRFVYTKNESNNPGGPNFDYFVVGYWD